MKHCFILKNDFITLELTPYGAAMSHITLSDGTEPLMSLSSYSDYAADPSYAGTIIAPAAGRIKNACLQIAGTRYDLTKNEGDTNLHSGRQSSARMVWDTISESSDSITFECRLKDGLDGFPGNRIITACYRVENKNISVTVTCSTDAPTYFNPTIHAYWNFKQGTSVLDHQLWIPARRVWINDGNFIPAMCIPVQEKTLFVLYKNRTLNEAMAFGDKYSQLADGRGYNNAFHAKQARLSFENHTMLFTTDAPDIWLYTGGYLGSATKIKYTENGKEVIKDAFPSCALALEATDAGSHTVTVPGTAFVRNFCYSFE